MRIILILVSLMFASSVFSQATTSCPNCTAKEKIERETKFEELKSLETKIVKKFNENWKRETGHISDKESIIDVYFTLAIIYSKTTAKANDVEDENKECKCKQGDLVVLKKVMDKNLRQSFSVLLNDKDLVPYLLDKNPKENQGSSGSNKELVYLTMVKDLKIILNDKDLKK